MIKKDFFFRRFPFCFYSIQTIQELHLWEVTRVLGRTWVHAKETTMVSNMSWIYKCVGHFFKGIQDEVIDWQTIKNPILDKPSSSPGLGFLKGLTTLGWLAFGRQSGASPGTHVYFACSGHPRIHRSELETRRNLPLPSLTARPDTFTFPQPFSSGWDGLSSWSAKVIHSWENTRPLPKEKNSQESISAVVDVSDRRLTMESE